MANSRISAIKSTLRLGARTNKFDVKMEFPAAAGSGEDLVQILTKEAVLPGRSTVDVEVWIQGRLITVAGDAAYDGTWTLTFIDSQDHELRKVFIKWMDFIDYYHDHSRPATDTPSYMTNAVIQQLDTSTNEVTVAYKIYNIYPKTLSEITYNNEEAGLVEYTVEFNYTHWTLENASSGGGGGFDWSNFASSAISDLLGGSDLANAVGDWVENDYGDQINDFGDQVQSEYDNALSEYQTLMDAFNTINSLIP